MLRFEPSVFFLQLNEAEKKKICLSFWIRLVNGKTSIELSKLR